MKGIEEGANIVNLLELLFQNRKVDKNVLLCNNRVPASLLIDDKYVIVIQENIAVHFRKGGQEALRKMARAREVQELVRQQLGEEAKVFCLSYVEMEYA